MPVALLKLKFLSGVIVWWNMVCVVCIVALVYVLYCQLLVELCNLVSVSPVCTCGL